jgi:hypothetical protein
MKSNKVSTTITTMSRENISGYTPIGRIVPTMSCSPLGAVIIEDTTSSMEVFTARKVKPIIRSLTPRPCAILTMRSIEQKYGTLKRKNRTLDRAFYQFSFGEIGVLVNKIWGRDKLEEIFNSRVKRLVELFGKSTL